MSDDEYAGSDCSDTEYIPQIDASSDDDEPVSKRKKSNKEKAKKPMPNSGNYFVNKYTHTYF